MNGPMFKIPEEPDLSDFEEDEELENGSYEREAQDLWAQQQEQNMLDEMENL